MPHSDHSPSPSATFPSLPPFPSTVPTAPLLRISLSKLLAHDAAEEHRCWEACQSLGFFYLDLRSSGGDDDPLLSDTDHLFALMQSFFDLPVSEKVQFDFKDRGSYFGYKGYGEGIVDKSGTRDRNEFFNVSKDDVLGVSDPLPCPAPLATEAARNVLAAYARRCHTLCMCVTQLLDQKLPLSSAARAAGGLQAYHRLDRQSGDQVRFVKAPPQEQSAAGVALGEHTDFGSVTVLFNRLGGLQVRLPPGMEPDAPAQAEGATEAEKKMCEDGWCYVRPLPGHCIVNLGDALVKFSDGRLRSNIHRVVAPPGEQASVTRYSLVYFCRPEDDVVLRSLVGGGDGEGEGVTAKEWILRRALGRREPGGWEKSGGTEEGSMRKGGMRV